MFKKKVKNVYLGEAVLRPGKHYVIVQSAKEFIFPNPCDHNTLPVGMETSGVYCPSGYHPVSFTSVCYGGYNALLYVNDTSVKVKVYENPKTQQKFFPEFGVPVR